MARMRHTHSKIVAGETNAKFAPVDCFKNLLITMGINALKHWIELI